MIAYLIIVKTCQIKPQIIMYSAFFVFREIFCIIRVCIGYNIYKILSAVVRYIIFSRRIILRVSNNLVNSIRKRFGSKFRNIFSAVAKKYREFPSCVFIKIFKNNYGCVAALSFADKSVFSLNKRPQNAAFCSRIIF